MNRLICLIKNLFICPIIIVTLFHVHSTIAQSTIKTDSILVAQQLKILHQKRKVISKQLNIEEQKRGSLLQDLSAESQENLNIAQDSLCLELRSELVEINLRIKELTPKLTSSQLSQISEMIHNKHDKDSLKSLCK